MESQLLTEVSDELKSKIQIIDAPKQFKVEDIYNGIVVIHATWSGPSVIYLKTVLDILGKSNRTDFKIIILDIDKLTPEEQTEYLGFFSHGYLEGILIEKGQLVSKNEYGKGVESFNLFKVDLINVFLP